MAIDSSKMTYNKNKPTYSSKNDKTIASKLAGALKSKGYIYNSGVERQLSIGDMGRAEKAGTDTINMARKINQGDTYSGKVSNQLLHKYRSGFLAQNREGLNKLDFSNYSTYRQNKFDALNKLAQKESTEYSRYRDKVSDWQNDRSIALEYEYLNKKQNEAAAKAQAKADAAAAKEAAKAAKEAAKASKTKKSTGSKRGGTSSTYDDSDISTTNTTNTTQNTYNNPYENPQNASAYNQTMYRQQLQKEGYTQPRTQTQIRQQNLYNKLVNSQITADMNNSGGYRAAYEMQKAGNTTKYQQSANDKLANGYNAVIEGERNSGLNRLLSDRNIGFNTLNEVNEEVNKKNEEARSKTASVRYNVDTSSLSGYDNAVKKINKQIDQYNNQITWEEEQRTSGKVNLETGKEQKASVEYTNKLQAKVDQLERDAREILNDKYENYYEGYSASDMDKDVASKKKEIKNAKGDSEKKFAKMDYEALQNVQYKLQRSEDRDLYSNNEDILNVLKTVPYEVRDENTKSVNGAEVVNAEKNAVKTLNSMGYDGKRLLESYERDIDEQNYNNEMYKADKYATEHPFKASLASVPQNMAGAVATGMYAGQLVKNAITGKYEAPNYYSGAYQVQGAAQQERNTVTSNIQQNTYQLAVDNGIPSSGAAKIAETAGEGYQIAMSVADSMANRYAFGEASVLTMGAGAAAQASRDAAMEGYSSSEVAKITLAAGVFEVAFETFELEQLDAFKQSGGKGAKTFIKNMTKQGLNEYVGEAATEVSNYIADWWIKGGDSDYARSIENYMGQGMSYDEAKQKTLIGLAKTANQAGIAGFISGAMSGTIATAQGNAMNKVAEVYTTEKIGKAYKNDVDKVIEAGLDMREGTKSNETANKLLAKFAEDEKITNREVGQLVNTVVEETTAQKNEAIEVLGSALENKNTITSDTATKILNNDAAIEVVNAVTGSEITADSSVKEVQKAVSALQSSAYEGSQNTDTNTNTRQSNSALINLTNDASGVAYKGATVDVLGDEYKLSGNTTVAKGGIRKVGVIVDGKEGWVDADNVVAKDKNVGKIIENSYAFGKNGRAAFLTNFTGDTGADAYSQAFKDYYVAGLTGQSLESVVSDYGEVLPDTVKFNAWASGQNDESASLEKKEVNVAKARVETAKNENASNVGKVVKNANTNIDEATENALNGIANTLNREIRFIDNDDYNGKLEDGVIYISNTSENPIMSVISHEITHYGEVADPKGYADYKNTVINGLKKYDIDRYNRYADEIRKRYLAQDKAFSEKMLLDEIVANATEAFVARPTDFQSVVNQNPTFGNKIAKFLNNFIAWFEEQSYDVEDDAAKMLTEDVELFKEAAVKWQRMVELASAVDTKDSFTRYDLKSMQSKDFDFAKNMHKVFENGIVYKYNSNNFQKSKNSIIDNVNNFYKSIGNKAHNNILGDIRLDKRDIKNDNAHGLGTFKAAAYLAVPKVIENGEIVDFRNDWKNRGYQTAVIVGLVSVEVDGENYNALCGVVVSNQRGIDDAYVHDVGLILENGTPYKTKSSNSAALSGGVPFPDIYNVLQDVANVNGEQLERFNTQNKNDVKYAREVNSGNINEAQKMVDEAAKAAGYNIKAYHGSRHIFNSFDKGKLGSNTNTEVSKRWFFAADKETANSYYPYGVMQELEKQNPKMFNAESLKPSLRGKLYDLYIKMDNPLIVDVSDYDYESHKDAADAWTEYIDQAERDGNDGIILLNAMDNQLKTGSRESTVYMFRDSNQVKSAETVTYDDEGNVIPLSERFNENSNDIRFSLKKPVEQTKDLIAVHNLNPEKLLGTLNLGGFPMPSIAITKADLGHTNFGDISVMFRGDTINPKSNKKNKVYAADAWTPTFPTLEYEANMSAVRKARDIATKDISGNIPEMYESRVRSFLSGLEYNLNSYGGKAGLINRAKTDYAMKAAYLASKGENVDEIISETKTEMDPVAVKKAKMAIDKFGEEAIKETKDMTGQEIYDKYGYELKKLVKKQLIEAGIDEETAEQNLSGNTTRSKLLVISPIKNASKYLDNNGIVITTSTDYGAIDKSIDQRINEADYYKWLDELFNDVELNSGIYNGKEPYTPSGNMRSFNQMHIPLNAENVVKAMLAEKDIRNVSGFHGAKSVRAVAVDEFKNMNDIKKASSKLQHADEEEFNEKQSELDTRLSTVMGDILNNSKRGSSGNAFIDLDYIGETVLEASREETSPDKIQKLMAKYGWNASDSAAKEIFDIINEIKNMPVHMFEAKPQRVVGFDEIETVLLPDNISNEVKDALDQRNIPYEIYEKGNNEQRKKLLNAHEEALFSLKKGNNLDMNAEDDAMTPTSNLAQETMDLLKGYEITQTQIKAMFDKEVLKNNSDYSEEEFNKKISNIAAYLNGNYRKNAKMVMSTLQDVARGIMDTASEEDTSFRDENKAMRDDLRKRVVVLSDKQLQEVKHNYDSFADFRRAYMGKADFRTEDSYRKWYKQKNGTEISDEQLRQKMLDANWDELSSTYSGWFDANTNSGDQLAAYVDAIDAISEKRLDNLTEKYGHGTVDEMARSLANDMFADLMSAVSPVDNKEKWNKLRTQYAERNKAYKELLTQKYEERFQKLKERYENKNNRVLEQMARHKDTFNTRAANQRENAEKAKYKKDARKIYDSMNKMLTNPTDSKYIPVEMINDCIDVLKEINFDTGIRGKNGELTKAFYKLDQMRKSYESLRVAETGLVKDIGTEFDERIPAIIEQMKTLFENDRKISDLSTSELRDLVEGLSYINESVKKSTELIGKGKNIKSYQAAESIINDIKQSGGVAFKDNKLLSGLGNVANTYWSAILSPEREIRRMVGYKDNSKFIELTEDLTKGEEKAHKIQMDGEKILAPVFEGKKNEKELKRLTGDKAEWLDMGFKDENGKPVLITPAMRVSLYLHMQNHANIEHLEKGGFKVPDQKLYNQGKLAEAYAKGTIVRHVSRNALANLEQSMTDYEKLMAKTASKFFNDYSKKVVNETSRVLVGYDKARVKNYFPIRTDSDFLKKPFDSIAFDFSLENSGFLKSRQTGSKNPIMLEDVTSVLQRQLKSVSQYGGFAIPLSNFNKVLNVSLVDYNGSMKQTIHQTWGTTGMKYIENMIADINGARAKADPDAISKVLAYARGNIASYALVGNIVTTIKQAASYPTAAATLGYRALGDALAKSGQYISSDKRASKQALIDKYTAEHWIRRQGSAAYGTDLETIGSQNDILTKVKNVPVLGVLANSIQEVDIGTTFLLWDAAEANVSKNYNYEKGSDSYYRKVAEVYNKAIHDTQPNYSVMQRPDILRSKNEVTKGFTMFMTQRLQNGNIILDSTANLRAKELAYKNAKTDENMVKLKDARNEFAHAISSQVISLIVLNAMTLLGGALHHKMKRYKDKDGDITFESLMGRYVNDCFAAAAGSFLFGGEIYDFIQAQITGEKYYGISDNSISTISSIADSLDKSVSAVQKMWDEGMDSKEAQAKLTKAMWSTTKSISQLFGIPVNNVANVINGVRYHVEDAMNGEFGSFEAGEERTTTTLNDKYYDAIVSGDEDAKAHWYAELRDAGKDDKQIATEVRKHLKENQDVIDAADALNSQNYMAYDSLVNGLVSQGFSKEDVLQTVNNVAKSATETVSANAIETSDFSDVEYDGGEIETVDAPEAKGDGSTKSMYTQDMLKYALDNGDSTYAEQIVEDLKNAKYNSAISKGKTAEEAEETSNKAITSMVKSAYKDEFAKAFMDGDSTTTKKIAGILEGYGFDGNDFRSMVSDEVKDNFLEAYENGTDSELEKAMSKAEEAGYDESTVRGWVGLKDKYVEAYESGNTAEANKIAEKAYKLGYSEDAVLKWVGRTQYSDITDAADSVLKLAGSGNYSTNDMVKARDERIAELMAEGKTEQEARSSLKTAMTNYYHPIYVEASAEDRARIRNILDGYFWYGQGAKKKTNYWTAKKLEEWANWTSKEKDDEEEEKSTNLKAYW